MNNPIMLNSSGWEDFPDVPTDSSIHHDVRTTRTYLIRGFRTHQYKGQSSCRVLFGYTIKSWKKELNKERRNCLHWLHHWHQSIMIMINETSMKISTPEPFVPPPRISQVAVIAAGFAVTLLGSAWPIVVLIIAFLLSLFIPYCFRTTDHPEERRRLYHEYVQTPHPMIQKVLAVPEYVNLEERYWINSR